MSDILLLIGVGAAIFVGFNIGGSSTGVAFGPAVGAGLLSKPAAAGLMVIFVFLGGWTVGRNVIDTMGGRIVPASEFTLVASIVILAFIGGAMLVANLVGVPVSTSMTAVGAIAGLGLARGSLDHAVMGQIVSWWLLAPIIGFWCGAVLGRYAYAALTKRAAIDRSDGPMIVLDRTEPVPVPRLGPHTQPREVITGGLVLVIACYMAFSAGASNVANAVAPLVGSGEVGMDIAIILGAGAIGIGGFTIARRTIDTVGGGLTELPLLAALLVAIVSASVTTVLSWLGIPISLALTSIMCIVGLGWGRATRVTTVAEAVRGTGDSVEFSGRELAVEPTEPIGEEQPEELQRGSQLYDSEATARVIVVWIFSPSAAAGISYGVFSLVL